MKRFPPLFTTVEVARSRLEARETAGVAVTTPDPAVLAICIRVVLSVIIARALGSVVPIMAGAENAFPPLTNAFTEEPKFTHDRVPVPSVESI